MLVRNVSLLLALVPSGVPALTLRVPQNYRTVQRAIDAAQTGDEVVVSPGTYFENLVFSGRDITLRSTDPTGPEVVRQTVIDGALRGPVIRLTGVETEACVVQGLTIQNGSAFAARYGGGGIQGAGSHTTIESNWIRENGAGDIVGGGGGSGLGECHGMIRGNVIEANYVVCSPAIVTRADGLAILNCDGPIQGNLVRGNYLTNGLAFPSIIRDCDGNIVGNVLVDNFPSLAYCSALASCDGLLAGNIIWRSGRIAGCHGLIANNIVGGQPGDRVSVSSDPMFCCLPGWQGGGVGNITVDPQFVNPLNGDFHLLPTSPCIDAGMRVEGLGVDFDGRPRPQRRFDGRGDGSGYDIGAFEYPGGATSELVMNHLLGLSELDPLLRKACDPNRDGHIDAADAVALDGR